MLKLPPRLLPDHHSYWAHMTMALQMMVWGIAIIVGAVLLAVTKSIPVALGVGGAIPFLVGGIMAGREAANTREGTNP